jgi:hypothetical protein
MNKRIRLAFLACGLVIAGCCSKKNNATTQTAAAAHTQYPVIVHLVGRHHRVTISAGPHGPVYTVTTPEGRTLVADATLEKLQREQPAIYRELAPLMASESSSARKPTTQHADVLIGIDASVAR